MLGVFLRGRWEYPGRNHPPTTLWTTRVEGASLFPVATVIAPVSAASGACPRCGFRREDGAAECSRCGIVFAKAEARAGSTLPAPAVPPRDSSTPARWSVDAGGSRALLIGAGACGLVLAFPFTRFVFSYLPVLLHEFGHALFAWLFGFPSIPSFDFLHGGGITAISGRQTGLLVLVYGVWGSLLYLYRRHLPGIAALCVLIGLYTVVAFTHLHEELIIAMGHVTELALASVFLYRALGGSALKLPAERPLYAFLALFIVLRDAYFAFRLMTSPLERDIYVELKGGADMDLSALARALGIGLDAAAAAYFALCWLALPAAWAAFRYRESWQVWISRVFFRPFEAR